MAGGDLAANYQGAFDGHLSFGERPALLLVDFVMAYLDPASPLYAGVESARDASARLLEAARKAGLPVIHTNVEYEPGGANGGVFYRKVPALKVFDRGSPLGRFAPELAPVPGEAVFTKQQASAFFGTGLAEHLSSQGIDCLLIAGVSTSGCIRASALDACQHGFLPFVVRDACGDRHPAPHEANLFDLQAKYAEVIGLDQALALIGKAV